ncbi:metallophosphoesterase family protein [Coralloluteibacterium thermophilus]|uniref:Phosphoesterase n=1 Tax=Coralloluteibacterium thermophilum TaxID=2707049 RepID=A0ABV9NJQ8_9GAMM
MSALRIGVVADTHGLLRPEALAFLEGCDRILHAGDIGRPEVLDALRTLAPVTAIRGNVDTAAWASALPETVRIRLGDVDVLMLHDLKTLPGDPAAEGVRVVVSGHSHVPRCGMRDGVLHLNPGSAGPRRFRLPVAIGELRIDGARVAAGIVDLLDGRRIA